MDSLYSIDGELLRTDFESNAIRIQCFYEGEIKTECETYHYDLLQIGKKVWNVKQRVFRDSFDSDVLYSTQYESHEYNWWRLHISGNPKTLIDSTQFFYSDGSIKSVHLYKKNRLHDVKTYSPDGDPLKVGSFKRGNGYVILYDDFGEELSREKYRDGKVIRD